MSRCHTSKKEYHECTDTMAQMKNKTNETKNVHTVYSVICGHDKSAPTVGARGLNVVMRGQSQRTFRRRRGRFIAPVRTNYINATTYHNGCTRINIGCTRLSAAYIP